MPITVSRSFSSPSSPEKFPPDNAVDSPPPQPQGISEKKLAANRRNAQKSTGPRTAEGKARASKNATVHGFFARTVLIMGEDPHEYRAFRIALMRRLDPGDELELQFAEGVVANSWKQRRLAAAEARAHSLGTYRQCKSEGMRLEEMRTLYTTRPWAAAKALADDLTYGRDNVLSHFLVYGMRLQRTVIRDLRQLRELKSERRQEEPGEFTAELIARELAEEENERNEATEASPEVSDEMTEGSATDGTRMNTDKGGEEVMGAVESGSQAPPEAIVDG